MHNRLHQFWHSSIDGCVQHRVVQSSDEDFEVLIANYSQPRAILAVRSSVLKNALYLTTVYE